MGIFLIFLTLVFVFYGIIKNSNPILINNKNNDIIYDFKNNKKDEYDEEEDKIKINNFIINDNDLNNKDKNKEEEKEDEE